MLIEEALMTTPSVQNGTACEHRQFERIDVPRQGFGHWLKQRESRCIACKPQRRQGGSLDKSVSVISVRTGSHRAENDRFTAPVDHGYTRCPKHRIAPLPNTRD